MKNISIIGVIFLSFFASTIAKAEELNTKGCGNVECSAKVINPHRVVISVMNKTTKQPVAWDSVWITNQAWRVKPEILLTTSRLHGDTIDLAPMVGIEESTYTCWTQIGDDCLLEISFYFSGAAYEPCLDYQDVTINAGVYQYEPNKLFLYSIVYPENFDMPPVDSVWVENLDHEVLYVSHDFPKGMIDVSSLSRGYYNLCVPLGECTKTKRFFVRWNNSQDVDKVTTTAPAVKILRDGHLYIKRGEKEYTITGQEIIVP